MSLAVCSKAKRMQRSVWDAVHLAAAELRMRSSFQRCHRWPPRCHRCQCSASRLPVTSEAEVRFLLLFRLWVGWASFAHGQKRARPDLRPSRSPVWSPARTRATRSRAGRDLCRNSIESGCFGCRVFRLAQDLPARQAFLTAALRSTLVQSRRGPLLQVPGRCDRRRAAGEPRLATPLPGRHCLLRERLERPGSGPDETGA